MDQRYFRLRSLLYFILSLSFIEKIIWAVISDFKFQKFVLLDFALKLYLMESIREAKSSLRAPVHFVRNDLHQKS